MQEQIAYFEKPAWQTTSSYGSVKQTKEQQEELLARRRKNKDCRLGFITIFAHKHSAQTLTSVTLCKALKDNNEWQARMDEMGSQMLQLFGEEELVSRTGRSGFEEETVVGGDVAALHFVLNSNQDATNTSRHSINRVSFYRGCKLWLTNQSASLNGNGNILDRSGIDLAFAWLRAHNVHQIRQEYNDYNPPFEKQVRAGENGNYIDIDVDDVCSVQTGGNMSIDNAFWNILQTEYADLPTEMMDQPDDDQIARTENRLFVICDLGGETLTEAASFTRDAEDLQQMTDDLGNVRPLTLEEREREEHRTKASSKCCVGYR